MARVTQTVGALELLVDAFGCAPQALRATDRLELIFRWVVDDLGMQIVEGPLWRNIPRTEGIAGLMILEESHLSVYTYPELCLATFNLYSGAHKTEWPWDDIVRDLLGARRIDVRLLSRGAAWVAAADA